jgi:hypothetical protein
MVPQTVAQVSLALALAAYGLWLEDANSSLPDLLDQCLECLRAQLAQSESTTHVVQVTTGSAW